MEHAVSIDEVSISNFCSVSEAQNETEEIVM
jgi:hypothetical protein